ncbi:MAG: hypothetical protein HRU15_11590 [Planctomycetes bacterium]|nr:hypothetical protein [Planctomycetota bacterium]
MSDFIADLDRYTRGAWIPFWGHVKLKRFINFNKQSRPRVFWGIPIVIFCCLIIWGLFALRETWDTTGAAIKDNLIVLEQAARDIHNHDRQLLSADESKTLDQLDSALDAYGKDYPQCVERLAALKVTINQRRYLDVLFDSEFDDSQLNANKQRLAMANGEIGAALSSSWNMLDGGLLVSQDQSWELAPYGKGLTYCFVKCYIRPPFELSISENDRSSHKSILRYDKGEITLSYKRDEMSEKILWRKKGVSKKGYPLRCAICTDANSLIFYWPKEVKRFTIPALRQGAASSVKFDISGGSVLERLYIGLEKPPK